MRRPFPRRSTRLRRLGALALSAPVFLALAPAVPVPEARASPLSGRPAATASPYLVGAGSYDITGAVAEAGAFGYAARQDMAGLHQRLYARSFIIGDPVSDRRVVFVSADLGAIFPSVTTAVLDRLRARFGDRYSSSNVMLTATHTHAATSGLAHEKLYQIAGADRPGYGYAERDLDTVVTGIVRSVERADANLEPGHVELASGELTGVTKNRSIPAYDANPDAAEHPHNVNTTMTQLKLTSADGRPVGLVNWFAIHPTSFSNTAAVISGDSKGFAQYTAEQRWGASLTDPKAFVAAFANADAGDTVAVAGNSHSSAGFQGADNDYLNAEKAGRAQIDKAVQLWDGPGRQLTGGIDHRSRWVDFGNYTVGAAYTGGAGERRLCAPARGFSFAAGSENGPSEIPGIYEGMTRDTFALDDAFNKVDQSPLGTLVRTAFGAVALPWQDPCHEEKPVLLPDGAWGWAPTVLPVQLFRIGSLAIMAVPGEPTTAAGRKLRRTVLDVLRADGVDTVVLAGPANAYGGYLTTREEYAKQHYEGASTEFGPHELGAFQQEAAKLADAMKGGTAVADDRKPPRIAQDLTLQRPGVVFDDVPAGQVFGEVLTQPAASYVAGQTASAVFRGAHPKNDYRTQGTFLKVQQLRDGVWVDHLTDRDWDTSYLWKREGVAYSRTTVEWRVRAGTPAGTYRLVQTGDWKNGTSGQVNPYTGISRSFTVG